MLNISLMNREEYDTVVDVLVRYFYEHVAQEPTIVIGEHVLGTGHLLGNSDTRVGDRAKAATERVQVGRFDVLLLFFDELNEPFTVTGLAQRVALLRRLVRLLWRALLHREEAQFEVEPHITIPTVQVRDVAHNVLAVLVGNNVEQLIRVQLSNFFLLILRVEYAR